MPAGDLSEFTFGFAYTYELANLWKDHLVGAPVIPNQVQEGQPGGGYDLALASNAGFVYFVQFKLSAFISHYWLSKQSEFGEPFYRFLVYGSGSQGSQQHALLLALEQADNRVEYVAPRFHTKAALDPLYLSASVRTEAFRIRPSAIGPFEDDEDHHVLCSVSGLRRAVASELRILDGPVDCGAITDSGFADDHVDQVNVPEADTTPADRPGSTLGERLESAQALLISHGGMDDRIFAREDTLIGRVRAMARVVLGAEMFVVAQAGT